MVSKVCLDDTLRVLLGSGGVRYETNRKALEAFEVLVDGNQRGIGRLAVVGVLGWVAAVAQSLSIDTCRYSSSRARWRQSRWRSSVTVIRPSLWAMT